MQNDLSEYCEEVKKLAEEQEYQKCEDKILVAMKRYPHSPVPHNLYGVLLERKHNHLLAMKHFRVACDLDPTYIPARYNMEQYGQWNKKEIQAVYSEEDCAQICQKQQDKQFYVKYDENGVGHILYR